MSITLSSSITNSTLCSNCCYHLGNVPIYFWKVLGLGNGLAILMDILPGCHLTMLVDDIWTPNTGTVSVGNVATEGRGLNDK
eukprot:11661016-Ditylum_brightwellii.AAC.1